MQYEAILLTLAEVAITIAGFSGVVVVLGSRQDPEKHRANAFQTMAMVAGALQAVAYPIFPLILFESGLESDVSWRVACALYGLGTGAGSIYFFLRFRRLAGAKRSAAVSLLWFLALLFAVLSLGAAVGWFGAFTAVVYMACVLNMFVQVAYNFALLLSVHLSSTTG